MERKPDQPPTRLPCGKRNPEYRRAQYLKHKERTLATNKAWRENNPFHMQYAQQRCNARNRGIKWEFSYKAWLRWWGIFVQHRGKYAKNLAMARFGDTGPYSPSNCYRCTSSENTIVNNTKENLHYSLL